MPPPPQQPYPNGPQQPPYPYGQPPPQAAPGPYGSPYPPQPYPPQQPYGLQPYPWGAPPLAPLPKKRRVGLILGIVGGAVAAVVVVLVLLAGLAAGSGFPEAKNKLTLPRTLLAGKYRLARDLSGTEGKKIENEADGAWDAQGIHGVVGSYDVDGDATKGTLVVSGMYGRFKNGDAARTSMMKGAAEGAGATVAVPAKDFGLSGVTITCEVITQEQMGTKITVPMCAWADGNTGATVATVDTPLASKNPSDVDLPALAKNTLEVRSEAVKPIG
ncbi:hypothetical protein AB5J72_32820 [Streptomyces sp. CG1]|uniref:hypothetical protein n=1 Tax=Streptomyces sp. CG1 TaxID=1287523 RepID=UPI0034E25247